MSMRSLLFTVLLLSLPATHALAQDAGPGWAPTLIVRGIPARPEGSRASQVSGDRKLIKGQPALATIWTGGSLCTLGIGSVEPMEISGPAGNVWKMRADYLGEQGGRHQIQVTSGFTRVRGQDASAPTTQTLSLADGDSVVLDALSGPLEASCQVHTVTFEAQLVLQAVDPALARAAYAADLWLVHTDPSGTEQREHLVANVRADGPPTPFMFTPLTFPIPVLDARQGKSEAAIRLSGFLRVRPSANGEIVIDLATNRPIFDLQNPDLPPGPPGSPIRMSLTTRPNETSAVDFASPSSGTVSVPLSVGSAIRAGVRPGATAGQPTDAVQVKNDKLVLYTFQFFKGHSTRLLITLKPLR